jgi:hypothetical protein
MGEKLLPCRWCSPNVIPINTPRVMWDSGNFFVACPNCGACGPSRGATENEAIDLWNTPAPTDNGVREELIDLADDIVKWSESYPVSVFGEPTPEKAQEVCEALGCTLDSFSAMVLRHFTKNWGNRARQALDALGEGGGVR